MAVEGAIVKKFAEKNNHRPLYDCHLKIHNHAKQLINFNINIMRQGGHTIWLYTSNVQNQKYLQWFKFHQSTAYLFPDDIQGPNFDSYLKN